MNTHSPNQPKPPPEKPEPLLNLRITRLRDRGVSPDLAAIIAPLAYGEVSR